jgi:hypothetical protein
LVTPGQRWYPEEPLNLAVRTEWLANGHHILFPTLQQQLSSLTSIFILRRTADILRKYLPPKGKNCNCVTQLLPVVVEEVG